MIWRCIHVIPSKWNPFHANKRHKEWVLSSLWPPTHHAMTICSNDMLFGILYFIKQVRCIGVYHGGYMWYGGVFMPLQVVETNIMHISGIWNEFYHLDGIPHIKVEIKTLQLKPWRRRISKWVILSTSSFWPERRKSWRQHCHWIRAPRSKGMNGGRG